VKKKNRRSIEKMKIDFSAILYSYAYEISVEKVPKLKHFLRKFL
jgi:hypothetical protein